MYFGNSSLGGAFIGNAPIKTIYLGNTVAWSNPYTYAISDVKIAYSSGSKVLTDRSNYGYASCTLKTYKNGSLVKTEQNKRMPFNWSSTSAGLTSRYCEVTDDGKIYFNPEYQTENMSFHSDPMTLSLNPYLNGYEHANALFIQVQPNHLVSSTLQGYSTSILPNFSVLSYNQEYLYVHTDFFENLSCTYNSGKRNITQNRLNVYYFDNNNEHLGTCTNGTQLYIGTNKKDYPIVHQYRFSHSLTSYEQDDVYMYMMQRRNHRYTEDEILCLYDTDGNQLQYGDTVKSNDLNDIILLNDAHKYGTYYEFDTDNSTISVREENGVIIISNVTSSLNNYLYITIYYTDEEGREFEDYAYIILNYWM